MVKRIILIIAIAMIAFSGVALANDTATVDVTATVVGTCKFATDGSVAFGDLDPSVGTDKNGTVTQPTFWCTKNAGFTITDDNGLNAAGSTHQMKHASLSDVIAYTFTYTTTGTGNGPSSPLTMDIASAVLGADYIDKSAGDYADTVTLTINP